MLAITTRDGTSLTDPANLKNSPSSLPISSSLQCFMNVWSPDSSQLYLASSSSIKRYTPSECLLEDLYHGPDAVTCLAVKENNSQLFFAAANKVWSMDCTHSPGEVLSSLDPHKKNVTRISMSNDGTLLASVSASAVFVHNLVLSSHAQLKGLPDRKPVACCLFHQHSKTRLLLGVGRDVVVYDSTRPSSPLKIVRIPGGGDIVGVAVSPFSKTLIAAVTSNGDVALVDLEKDNGILKTVNVKTPLTCCAFTAEGAAIYLGSESGKLLVLDLRSLEKEPKSFTVGDGGAPIMEINVQERSKSHTAGTVGVKARLSSTASISPQRPTSSTRPTSIGTGLACPEVKSPKRVASKIRGGGGVTPKKKLFSPPRVPLSETKNTGLDARLAASRSPKISHRLQPLKLYRSKEQQASREIVTGPPSPTSHGLTEPPNVRQRARPGSSYKIGQEVERLGLGPAPESISGHLAAMRVRSGLQLNRGLADEGDQPKTTSRRVVSESTDSTTGGRRLKLAPAGSGQNKASSSKVHGGVVIAQQKQERRSDTPNNSDDQIYLSPPELPHEPVTPISLGKNATKIPLASATSSGISEVVEVKKTRFAGIKESLPKVGDESEDEGSAEVPADERLDEEQEKELSLQVSPRRPTAPPTWLQSPHRPSAANLNMNGAAQDFLRGIVRDVMYDFQRETKAEMMGLHLDLVRMGRGWKQELREIMEEWSGEMRELKAENRRLREENERLRRGY